MDKTYFSLPASVTVMTALAIRAATVEDIPAIVQVRLAALSDEEIRGFSAPEFATFSSVKRLRDTWDIENRLADGFEVFVAEIEGKVVGFTVFKIERDYSYLDNIVVARAWRGKGVGRALVAFVEDAAKAKGCNAVKTDTTENAEGVPWKAYGFWVKLGYKDAGKRLPTKYDFKEIPLVKQLK